MENKFILFNGLCFVSLAIGVVFHSMFIHIHCPKVKQTLSNLHCGCLKILTYVKYNFFFFLILFFYFIIFF